MIQSVGGIDSAKFDIRELARRGAEVRPVELIAVLDLTYNAFPAWI